MRSMISAYNETNLRNLNLLKDARQWLKSHIISPEQFAAIQAAYPSHFFHPNLMIRILLFIASWIAIGGITGLFFLFFSDLDKYTMSVMAFFYGAGSLVLLEIIFIGNRHYKSGVTEAVLYHAMGFSVAGLSGLTDFNEHAVAIACVVVFTLGAIRYHDLLTTLSATGSWAYFIFFELFELGEAVQPFIPLVLLILFTPVYFFLRRLRHRSDLHPWYDCLVVAEALSLVIIYLSGNYFIVREASEKLLNFYVHPGRDIPLAWLFYGLTVLIPVMYLYWAIVKKDVVLLRVSLLALAFSVFTFKYYYSTGHHEITFTLAGTLLILISIGLFRYLKTDRHGFTRENLLNDKWTNSQAEAFIISQTLGGNKGIPETQRPSGGGSFGGGGASGDF